MDPPRFFDRQAAATLVAGSLLLAISLITNDGDADLLHISTLPLAEQVGVSLHAAALAALVGDAQLATRLRDRERNRMAEERQRKTRRHLAVIRFQLADTPRSRLQLNETLALLLEELNL